ncbi:MAG: hypothetical protein ACFE91_03990 [Promethearchaeota archaeon]
MPFWDIIMFPAWVLTRTSLLWDLPLNAKLRAHFFRKSTDQLTQVYAYPCAT